ncbi:hypothetical protein BC833DRAFT_596596 [Globomyces pollinis-pini]|nr:hypothetical protein BC833DRAFT_596596 [Globomyces pollinis-pini]
MVLIPTTRKATLKDVNSISKLFNNYRIKQSNKSNLKSTLDFLSNRLYLNDSEIFIAMENHIITGMIQLLPSFDTKELKRIWILSDIIGDDLTQDVLMTEAMSLCKRTEAMGVMTLNQEVGIQLERAGFRKHTDHMYIINQ